MITRPMGSTRRKKFGRGLAIVEAAITLPFIMMLLLATSEIGRAIYQYNAVVKSVRDAARFLAVPPTTSTGVLAITDAQSTTAKNLAVFGNPAGSGQPVAPGLATGDVTVGIVGEQYVQVVAQYTFQPLFGAIPMFGFGTDITLGTYTATATMRGL